MRYRISPDVVWTASDEEIRLYEPRSGEFRTLNSSAASIWLRFAEPRSAEEVSNELAGQFGAADPAQRAMIARDVQEFMDLLIVEDMLQADPRADGSTEPLEIRGTADASGPAAGTGATHG